MMAAVVGACRAEEALSVDASDASDASGLLHGPGQVETGLDGLGE